MLDTNSVITNENNTNISYKGYLPIRTNEDGEIWFTSERLYKYRLYTYDEVFVTKAEVKELFETFAVLMPLENAHNTNNLQVEPLMKAKLVE